MNTTTRQKIQRICFCLSQDLGFAFLTYKEVTLQAFGVLARVFNYWIATGEISKSEHRECCLYACKQIDYEKAYCPESLADEMMKIQGYREEMIHEVLEYLK